MLVTLAPLAPFALLAATAAAAPAPLARQDIQRWPNVTLHPNGDTNLCVQPVGGDAGVPDGTDTVGMEVGACDGSLAQRWNLASAPSAVWTPAQPPSHGIAVNPVHDPTANTAYYTNGSPVILELLVSGTSNQFWTYDGSHLQHLDRPENPNEGVHCLDLTDGVHAPGTRLQLWECYEENTNQRWTVGE